jgi:hypothetical protein
LSRQTQFSIAPAGLGVYHCGPLQVDTPAARRLLQDLFVTEADILPDAENKILKIKVHSASRPAANRSFQSLFEKLNEAEIIYPGTNMRLIYELGGC